MEKNWESYDKPNYKRMMTESVVEEPDWIPDGDGRAIGQQDFAINLSPLHAESGDSYTVAYAVHNKYTGEEIDDGEITIMASSPMEAKNEVMRMLEEGGLDDEEYELHTPRKEAEFRAYDDDISSRQEWMIKKLGGTPKKSMTRSDASDYIKELQGKKSGTWQAETLAEIEGPTAEATAGGLHSPSSFTIGWEDDAGYSSASLPPNEIAWAEDVKGSESFITGSILAVGLGIVGVIAAIKFGKKKSDTASGDDTKKAEKGCGCSKTVKKSSSVKESEYSVNQINPVEVEGQNDIHNAESVKLPSPYSGPQTAHRQNNRPTRNLW